MKELKQITVIGLGLLGGSITLTVSRSFPRVKTVGYTHRRTTRAKARELAVAGKIVDSLAESVQGADLVILATPIHTFEAIFSTIGRKLTKDCIVTDVGSAKVLPHRWSAKRLPSTVHYVGSHPIAGSEQRGVEFARDDLFDQADCILTTTKSTNRKAVAKLRKFWSALGCTVKVMSPAQHDRIFANVSHLPHIVAAALINASETKELEFAGKGFIDTSRIASGPANIWTDVLLTNSKNCTKSIDRITGELEKLKRAIEKGDKGKVEKLLESARSRRAALMKHKMRKGK